MHVPFEGPGFIVDWFEARGYSLKIWKLFEKTEFPEPEGLDVLILMGGPMNIYEYKKYPYLKAETAFITECIQQKKKVLGICLGAQLIADALGRKIYPAREKEIGWYPVSGNWSLIPDSFIPFHWHGETFDLPEGAVRIASSEVCLNQGFRYKDNVLALQFHLEVTSALINGLIDNAGSELVIAPWIQSSESIRSGLVHAESNRNVLYNILDNFIPENDMMP